MAELRGRVVAITGAARGMGRAYTRAFLAQGARVVAMDRSWEPSGFSGDRDDDFRRELQARSDDVLLAAADVTNDSELDATFDATIKKWGTVDVLINNAAMRQRDLFPPSGSATTLQTSDSDWERMFAVNVFGVLKVTRRFIGPMLDNQRGSVISIISSGALHHSHGGAYVALRPNSREMPYQSTKSALLTMMFYLADEVKDRNVAVNIMIPGHTRTTGSDEQTHARRELEGTSRNTPPRLKPEHMIPLALFLAEQTAATGVTGKCFDTVTWNMEHGAGGPEAWIDTEAMGSENNEVLAGRR